jgi:hypothetical protein
MKEIRNRYLCCTDRRRYGGNNVLNAYLLEADAGRLTGPAALNNGNKKKFALNDIFFL